MKTKAQSKHNKTVMLSTALLIAASLGISTVAVAKHPVMVKCMGLNGEQSCKSGCPMAQQGPIMTKSECVKRGGIPEPIHHHHHKMHGGHHKKSHLPND